MRVIGKVKFFNAEKCYGFIVPDDGSEDVFVHGTALKGSGHASLVQEQHVSFEIIQSDKGNGRKAANVIPL